MARFIFYTDQGITIAPNGSDVENFQIIGFEDGKTEVAAKRKLLKNNKWILDKGFSKDNIKCYAIFQPNIINELETVVEYLWRDEKRHYSECVFNNENTDIHIFNSVKKIKKAI